MTQEEMEVLATRAFDAYNARDATAETARTFSTGDAEVYAETIQVGFPLRDGYGPVFADADAAWREIQSIPQRMEQRGDQLLVTSLVKGVTLTGGVELAEPYYYLLSFGHCTDAGEIRITRMQVFSDKGEASAAAPTGPPRSRQDIRSERA